MPFDAPISRQVLRILRGIICYMGIAMLLMQLVGATRARAQDGEWIEICTDLGVALIQLVDDQEHPASKLCPDCDQCTLCAMTGTAPIPKCLDRGARPYAVLAKSQMLVSVFVKQRARLMPDNRGPPTGSAQDTRRAAQAFMTTIPGDGGVS